MIDNRRAVLGAAFCGALVALGGCGSNSADCSGEVEQSLAAEIAIDLVADRLSEVTYEMCQNAMYSLNMGGGIFLGTPTEACLENSYAHLSIIAMPESVTLSGIRTTSDDTAKVKTCAATANFSYGASSRNRSQEIYDYFFKFFSGQYEGQEDGLEKAEQQATALAQGTPSETDASMAQGRSVAIEYDAQLSDDGSEVYVNALLAQIPAIDTE